MFRMTPFTENQKISQVRLKFIIDKKTLIITLVAFQQSLNSYHYIKQGVNILLLRVVHQRKTTKNVLVMWMFDDLKLRIDYNCTQAHMKFELLVFTNELYGTLYYRRHLGVPYNIVQTRVTPFISIYLNFIFINIQGSFVYATFSNFLHIFSLTFHIHSLHSLFSFQPLFYL